MDSDVKAEQFDETMAVGKAKEIREVPRVIFRGVDGWKFTIAKDIVVNTTSNVRQFSDSTESCKNTRGVYVAIG